MSARDGDVALDILMDTIRDNPDMWEIRKKTATLLWSAERFDEAAEIVWNAPSIPFTDLDVAFTFRMTARGLPEVATKFVSEVIQRNREKPLKNIAVARILNKEGFYMAAAKFYGAALAIDSSLVDVHFEEQALWMDDSASVLEKWNGMRGVKADDEPLLSPEDHSEGFPLRPRDIAVPEETQEMRREEGSTANYLAEFGKRQAPVRQPQPQTSSLSQNPLTAPLQSRVPQSAPLQQVPVTAPLGRQVPELQRPQNPLTAPLQSRVPQSAPLQQIPLTAPLLRAPSSAPAALNTSLPVRRQGQISNISLNPKLRLK